MRLYLLLLAALLYCGIAKGQPTFPPPAGVFCSCGPTTGIGYGSVDPAIASKPFVKGILVRVNWDLLEPTDNTYKWALIDSQISAAKQYNKKISLGIGCGIAIPQWVFALGAQYLVSSVPIADTIAIPWDNTFLNKWTEFIAALGMRYKNDTTIQLVYITNSTGNGFEMQLPFVTTPTLAAAGYTDAKVIQSWETVMDAFNAAFPNHYLSNDFHPVNGSNVVADSVYAYARSTIGTRYGANAWWWTQKNTSVYPAQYDILQHSSANNTFTGVQFAYNGTTDSAKFGAGGMPAALQLAITNKVCYWEVWNQDILNLKFDSLLNNSSCSAATHIATMSAPLQEINIFPNPANEALTIELPNEDKGIINVINPSGILIKEITFNRQTRIVFNTAEWLQGYYILTIKTDSYSKNIGFTIHR